MPIHTDTRVCRFCEREDKKENLVGYNGRWYHFGDECKSSRAITPESHAKLYDLVESFLDETGGEYYGKQFDSDYAVKPFLSQLKHCIQQQENPPQAIAYGCMGDEDDFEEEVTFIASNVIYREEDKPQKGVITRETLLEDRDTEILLVKRDREIAKLKDELKTTKALYNASIKEANNLDLPDWVKELKDYQFLTPHETISLDKDVFCDNRESALMLLSDWHFFKRIEKNKTNGRNEYNFDTAEKRWNETIRASTLKLQSRKHLDNLVLWLGGDFLENYLRPENRSTNYGSPTEEFLEAFRLIKVAIANYADLDNIGKITVVCSAGNHGRLPEAKKTPVSTRTEESLEQLLYWQLKRTYDSDRINFVIKPTYKTYVQVYDTGLCFHHGDGIKGGSSKLNGIIPAINRYVYGCQQADPIKVHRHVIGHFHTLVAGERVLLNGCGCGFDETYEYFNYGWEAPQQLLQIIDSKNGVTDCYRIFSE